MVKERLLVWAKHAKDRILPSTILFYRDGVSDSQFGMVYCEEKDQIMAGFKDAYERLSKSVAGYPKKQPAFSLVLIVVTKRHHARFFPKEDGKVPGGKRPEDDPNLQDGTLVDRGVVTPNHYSFYLQSHHSPLGTAKTGHYVVVFDNSNKKIPRENLQKIV